MYVYFTCFKKIYLCSISKTSKYVIFCTHVQYSVFYVLICNMYILRKFSWTIRPSSSVIRNFRYSNVKKSWRISTQLVYGPQMRQIEKWNEFQPAEHLILWITCNFHYFLLSNSDFSFGCGFNGDKKTNQNGKSKLCQNQNCSCMYLSITFSWMKFRPILWLLNIAEYSDLYLFTFKSIYG